MAHDGRRLAKCESSDPLMLASLSVRRSWQSIRLLGTVLHESGRHSFKLASKELQSPFGKEERAGVMRYWLGLVVATGITPPHLACCFKGVFCERGFDSLGDCARSLGLDYAGRVRGLG